MGLQDLCVEMRRDRQLRTRLHQRGWLSDDALMPLVRPHMRLSHTLDQMPQHCHPWNRQVKTVATALVAPALALLALSVPSCEVVAATAEAACTTRKGRGLQQRWQCTAFFARGGEFTSAIWATPHIHGMRLLEPIPLVQILVKRLPHEPISTHSSRAADADATLLRLRPRWSRNGGLRQIY